MWGGGVSEKCVWGHVGGEGRMVGFPRADGCQGSAPTPHRLCHQRAGSASSSDKGSGQDTAHRAGLLDGLGSGWGFA